MIKTSINLQDLRRRIYRKAKSDKEHRFWGIYVHITKIETLKEAYLLTRRNGCAPGIDGKNFADIESQGLDTFLSEIRNELLSGNYKPQENRKVEIPKDNGKVRMLQIPTIRERVVQGALKLILEAIFEADFCPNSYGFRPKRSPQRVLAEVRRSILRRMTRVIDVDLTKYFDMVRHSILLDKIAKRVEDPDVMHLVKQIIKAAVKTGVPQGGPFSPLVANIYLNDLDWYFDGIRQMTSKGGFEAVNYHHFADDIVITVSELSSKNGWTERALKRLKEYLIPLGVSLNIEKSKIVNMLNSESFGFLGFDYRRTSNRKRTGFFILMTPKKKARKAIKAKIRTIIANSGALTAQEITARINPVLSGCFTLAFWVYLALHIQ